MSDPELRSDESVILRTQGIFVKSIPFEGILTNKRIILVDRAKNLLPQKEIPLVTIKDVDTGENAIRDQIITLSVVSRSGEMRQMILTFSRQTGGNRIRERDAWAKALKDNISSSFEQVIRKVIPSRGPAPRKKERTISPHIEIISPESQNAKHGMKITTKEETEVPLPVKISETTQTPAPSSAEVKGSDMPVSGFGTYCSRCGNRVPEGSGFCNRCGSPIVVPGSRTVFTRNEKVTQSFQKEAARNILPVNVDEYPLESRIDRSAGELSQVTLGGAPQEPETAEEPIISAPPQETAVPESELLTPRIYEEPMLETPVTTSSQVSGFNLPAGKPPAPRSPRGFSSKAGSKTKYAIVIAILIIATIVGGFFIYPMIAKGGIAPNTSTSPTPVTTTPVSSGTINPRVTTEVTVPVEGVYVRIEYLGSFNGTYGINDLMQKVRNSGDRLYPIDNATGNLTATFYKEDRSSHVLSVEIWKNGKLLTSGNTTAGFGKVSLLVNIATGVAQPPQVSTGTAALTAAATTSAAQKTGNVTAPSTTVANVTP